MGGNMLREREKGKGIQTRVIFSYKINDLFN